VPDNQQNKLLDGLQKAYKTERDGHSFYMMAANSTQDDKGKQVFMQLAQDEMEHMRFLRTQYESVLNTGKVDHGVKLPERTELSGMSPIFSESLKGRVTEAHFEMSALSIGIQLELDSMNFYKARAEESDDPDVQSFYTELAEWERGHYQALLNQHESLKGDYWADSGFAPF
jgi:rubrerythrin